MSFEKLFYSYDGGIVLAISLIVVFTSFVAMLVYNSDKGGIFNLGINKDIALNSIFVSFLLTIPTIVCVSTFYIIFKSFM